MGMDVFIAFDVDIDLLEDIPVGDLGRLYTVSRTFCNFLSRRNVVDGSPELDQIGLLTEVDIQFIYDLEAYIPEYDIDSYLDEMAMFEPDSFSKEETKLKILAENEKYANNIEEVISTLTILIQKVRAIDDLQLKLDDNGWDSIGSEYFIKDYPNKDFDNLINDLENLLRSAKFGKEKEAKTICFAYG